MFAPLFELFGKFLSIFVHSLLQKWAISNIATFCFTLQRTRNKWMLGSLQLEYLTLQMLVLLLRPSTQHPFSWFRRLIKRRRRLSKALDLAGLEAPWMKIKRRDEWDRFFKTFFKDDFDTKLDIFPKNSLGKIILLCKSLAFTAKFEICNFSLSSILMTFFSDF